MIIIKLIKNTIFTFLLGAVIFSGITVYAVNISSANVEYNNQKSGLQSTNVFTSQYYLDILTDQTVVSIAQSISAGSTFGQVVAVQAIPINE